MAVVLNKSNCHKQRSTTRHCSLDGVDTKPAVQVYADVRDPVDVFSSSFLKNNNNTDSLPGVTVEGTNNAAVRKLMEEAEEDYLAIVPKLDVGTTTVSFGSDHVPFQQAGVPCYLAIEMDDTDYPGYHKTSDTVAYMNWGQAIDILKGMAGTLCRRAGLA